MPEVLLQITSIRIAALALAFASLLAAPTTFLSAQTQSSTLSAGNNTDSANGVEIARMVDEPARRVVRLANGLTIILQENHTAPVVACRVYVRAGSLTEQQYMGAGISHVLEHLVAGASSAKRKEKESKELLRTIGNDSNAYTSFDHTCYFITTTAQKWPIAMDLLSDWVTNADFTEAEFRREYQVVQRELEMGEAEAGRTFSKLQYANRYLVHPAMHPVIGYKAAFQKLTRQDCQAYYNQMYVPDNMIVSVAGDITLDEAQQRIADRFSHANRKKVPSIALPDEPPVAAPRTLVAHADVKQARAEWAFPTITMYDPDLYALDVLANVLGQGESSILVQSLRDQQQLVTGISSYSDTPGFAPGEFAIVAELPAERIPEARQGVLKEIRNVIDHPVDAAQLEKAKTQMAAETVYGNQTAEQQASRNASDFLGTGNINFEKLYIERIKQVTPEQIQAVAKKYLQPEKLLTSLLLPLGAKEPPPTTQSVETISKLPVEKFQLDNGLTVLVCKNTAAPLVAMNLYVLGGLLAEDDKSNGVGNAMMTLLDRGTTNRDEQAIAQFFDATGGTISAVSGNNTFGVSATSLKENAKKTFDVFADVCLHPSFQQEQLDRVRPRLLAAISHSTEDWFGEGYKLLRSSYFSTSPYHNLSVGKSEVVAGLTREQILQHYNTCFRNPLHAVLAIYGDVDPAQVKQWVTQFAELKKSDAPINLKSVASPAKTVYQKSRKGSATVMIGYGPGMTIDNPDRYPMTVLQTILGGYSYPSGWLFDTLRGAGLVYVVQASNITGPANGVFLIAALGEPENVPAIRSTIAEKIADAKAGKYTDQEMATAKDQCITSFELAEQTIPSQAADQALDELMGVGYNARQAFSSKIRAVTRADLIRVAEKYLNDPVTAVSSPEPPASQPATQP